MSILQAIGGLAGSAISGLFGNKAAKKQEKLQREFAQNSIQWKVRDAKKAGVHPLAALGATGYQYSPVSVGVPDLTEAGQSVGRALHAHMDTSERALSKLAVEKAGLENEYLRTQIASARARIGQHSQPAPQGAQRYVIDGQGSTALPVIDRTQGPQRTTHLRTPAGTVIATTPGSDAQTAQDRWGEAFEQLYGANNWYWERGRRAIMNYDHRRVVNGVTQEIMRWLSGRE